MWIEFAVLFQNAEKSDGIKRLAGRKHSYVMKKAYAHKDIEQLRKAAELHDF